MAIICLASKACSEDAEKNEKSNPRGQHWAATTAIYTTWNITAYRTFGKKRVDRERICFSTFCLVKQR